MLTLPQLRPLKGQTIYEVSAWNYHFGYISNASDRPGKAANHDLLTVVTAHVVMQAGPKLARLAAQGEEYQGMKCTGGAEWFASLADAVAYAQERFAFSLSKGSPAPVHSHTIVKRNYSLFSRSENRRTEKENPVVLHTEMLNAASPAPAYPLPAGYTLGEILEPTPEAVTEIMRRAIQ